MNESCLTDLFPGANFAPVSPALLKTAETHLDNLTKPVGSLGELELAAKRLYAIGNGREPVRVDPVILFTIAGDHGVAGQGVSPFPQIVTRQMIANILDGGAAISVLCRSLGITHLLVDAGCAGDSFAPHERLLIRRMGAGSADFSQGAAMGLQTCRDALRAGHELGKWAAANGFGCIAAGELGIANSTVAAALYCAFLKLTPQEAAGPGSGADPAMIARKQDVIAQALRVNQDAVASGDPLRILAALGGFEIAMLAGLMLACASQRLPLIVDGFICLSAYVVACAFFAPLSDYAFLAHNSAEPGFARAIARMAPGQRPLLSLDMRLGEGTGAALAVPLLRGAAAIFNEMATFQSAGVSATPADRLD